MEKKEKLLRLAADLDNDLETQDVQKLLPYFSEECEIEIFGHSLKGREGVEKWLKWFFGIFKTIKFEPIIIMVEENIFFEEFYITVSFENGETIRVKVAEVLTYENDKIRSLRLYLDRLEFVEASLKGFFSKSIVKMIKKKSVEGLF